MQWLITYTKDYNQTQQQQIIIAGSYTEAYLIAYMQNGLNSKPAAILEIKKI